MKKLPRKKISTAVYATLLACLTAFIPVVLVASVIDEAEQSVVRVLNLEQKVDGLYFNGFGSGVVVDNRGSILTNAHVLRGHDKIHVQWKTETGEVKSKEADVLKQDTQKDLALLRVSGLATRAMTIATHLPAKGSVVYAIGFPGVADTGATADDINEGFVEATITQGVVGRVLTREISENRKWSMVQHSAVISGGSSGGALVDACGYLVGINTSGALAETKKGDQVEASGFSFAIQSPQAFQFAADNGAEPSEVQTPCKPANDQAQGTRESLASGGLISPTILSLLIGAIAALAAAIAVFARSRRRGDRPLQSTRSTARIQWEIEGYTSTNEPVRFLVIADRHTEARPLIIGRDASCGVVITDATVSRTHAKLFVARGELWCADLGSSNGTKVNERSCGTAVIRVPRSGVLTLGKVSLRVKASDLGSAT
jgi:hypothetical protein